jgi:hypothetical protein
MMPGHRRDQRGHDSQAQIKLPFGQPEIAFPVSFPNKRTLSCSQPRSGRKSRTQQTRSQVANQTTSSNIGLNQGAPTGHFQPGERRVGRKPGVPNKATAEIKAVAQMYGKEAIERLVALMRGKDADVAFKACIALLDRAYGKPAQMLQDEPEKPLTHNVALADEFTRRIAAMAERVTASVQ